VTWAIARDIAILLVAAVAMATLVSLLALGALNRVDLTQPSAGVHLNAPTIDAGTLPFVVLIMLAAGFAAAWLPAWRAARADPLVVLRHE
jgi:ABC-type antimicrobial peptide transport system permease subunit